MKVDKDIVKVLSMMEVFVGMQCYNPNANNSLLSNPVGSLIGRDGLQYRYPVCYYKTKQDLDNHKLSKTKGSLADISPECFETARYNMGTNNLYIGNALIQVLDFLETRYDLDFSELERQYIEKKTEEELDIVRREMGEL